MSTMVLVEEGGDLGAGATMSPMVVVEGRGLGAGATMSTMVVELAGAIEVGESRTREVRDGGSSHGAGMLTGVVGGRELEGVPEGERWGSGNSLQEPGEDVPMSTMRGKGGMGVIVLERSAWKRAGEVRGLPW